MFATRKSCMTDLRTVYCALSISLAVVQAQPICSSGSAYSDTKGMIKCHQKSALMFQYLFIVRNRISLASTNAEVGSPVGAGSGARLCFSVRDDFALPPANTCNGYPCIMLAQAVRGGILS